MLFLGTWTRRVKKTCLQERCRDLHETLRLLQRQEACQGSLNDLLFLAWQAQDLWLW